VQQASCPMCLLHSGTHSRWNHQCKTVPYCSADYLPLVLKLCHEYLSNPLQINFLATGTLAANDFHLAIPTPVRLLKYSSCLSWSRWCICFVILLMCHICCIIAYTSLSSFLSKGVASNVKVLDMYFAQTCHMSYTIDYLSEGGYQSHSVTLTCINCDSYQSLLVLTTL